MSSPGTLPNFPHPPMTDQRLIRIEEKISFQEDQIEALNRTIYRQQQKLEQLEAFCKELAGRMRSLAEAGSAEAPGQERPPHY